jgi:ABC-2 type transport system ATP-binding protein
MIEIKNLTKTYPGNIQALSGLTLTIGSGMFGLVGPNGAGKTTLMRILAGLIMPTEGTVQVFGHDPTTPTGKMAIKARLGYLPQELGFYPNLSGQEFLDYIAQLKGITDRKERQRQLVELLELVRLADVTDRPLKTYSGGMKRRVGIAQALLGRPLLLIIDEPTVGLDPEERVRLRNLLSEVAGRCTVILSTHIIEDISQSCRALAVISQGRLLFQGSPHSLREGAQGRVWLVETSGERPEGDLTLVSSMQLAHATQYRVLGTPSNLRQAHPTEPSLEDGYIWLMQRQGVG